VPFEGEIVREIADSLPVCKHRDDQEQGSWSIKWRMPRIMKPFFTKVAHLPKLQEKIIEECQAAFNTGQIDRDSAEITFNENSITVMVRPGNGCWICCRFDGEFSDHNIDNSSQAYALLILFQIILRQIYECGTIWNDDLEACLTDRPTEKTYIVTRPIHAKPIRVWEISDEDCCQTVGYAIARDSKEAQNNVPGKFLDGGLGIKPIIFYIDIPKFFKKR